MITLSRRHFLAGAGAYAGLAALGCFHGGATRSARLAGDPFRLGVASGSPTPDGFVLWTRLAPLPPGAEGVPPEPVAVAFELAHDEGMTRIVRSGTAWATPELAHSVHVEQRGLDPARGYFYRFHAGGYTSPVGRTRTAPANGAVLDRLRFAFASCQNWEHGRFGAWRHIAADSPDLVVHLGDYIYEKAGSDAVRPHDGPQPKTLAQYRSRHALYKTDPDLQAAHAACPWLVMWDDHEVDNDYAGDHSQDGDPPEVFLARRAAAYQAYYEHMPLWSSAAPAGAGATLYRRTGFGDLLELFVVDGRQYRSAQPCATPGHLGGQVVASCAERLDPARTVFGPEQEAWLLSGLAGSRARWNVIGQGTLMAEFDQKAGPGEAYWTDGWDGYPAARERLLTFFRDGPTPNPVVIGGDIHSFWVTDLKVDARDPRAPVVATEFVGTSISSRSVSYETFAKLLPENPHVKFFESRQRGWVRCDVTPQHWVTELRVVEDVLDPASPASTLATFVVEDGRCGAQRA